MKIRYIEGSRSILDKYIKFRLNFITSICDIILPCKISNNKSIKSKLYNYYILKKFNKYDFDNDIKETNNSIFDIFNKLNIRNKELQEICFCIIEVDTLFDLKNNTNDLNELKYRKSVIDIATTIYIALQYDKALLQSKKVSFDEINKDIINYLKEFVDVELLIKLDRKSELIKMLFEKTIIKNSDFLDSLNTYSEFVGSLCKIKNANNEKMCISDIKYNFKEFEDDSRKEINRISDREIIKTGLNKIKIEISSLFLGMSVLTNNPIKLFIEINTGFISNNTNIQYIINRLNYIKDYVYLVIPLDSLEKYSDMIDIIKNNNINLAIRFSEKNVENGFDLKDIRDFKFLLINYSKNEMFGKRLSEIIDNKMIPIVTNIINKNILSKYKIEYYTIASTEDKK